MHDAHTHHTQVSRLGVINIRCHFVIFVGFNLIIKRIWFSWIKWSLSCIVSTHIIFRPVSSCLTADQRLSRVLVIVEIGKLATCTVASSSTCRGAMGRAVARARPTAATAQRQGNEVRDRAEAVLALRRTQTATVTVGERRSQVRAGAAAVV